MNCMLLESLAIFNVFIKKIYFENFWGAADPAPLLCTALIANLRYLRDQKGSFFHFKVQPVGGPVNRVPFVCKFVLI